MTKGGSLIRNQEWYPYIAVAAYVILIVAFLITIWMALADIFERRAVLNSSLDILGQLEARRSTPDGKNLSAGSIPAGSPFLGGETITVAGATLLQRVASAITQLGGSVQSSQVDLQGPQSKDGFATLLVNCEIGQPDLQRLLYDLEAGMPYLFVEQLVVQAPQTAALTEAARLRVLLAVSGQWQGSK